MSNEIRGLQYLRGLAAAFVVIDHAASVAAIDKYFGQTVLGGILTHGGKGVDLFFVLSGFIICITSLSEKDLGPKLGVTAFAARRFARIVPVMWLATISYAVFRILGRGVISWEDCLRGLFLFPDGNVQPPQLWTLRHELIFYTLFAISFLNGRRKIWIITLWVISPFIFEWLFSPNNNDRREHFLFIVANPVNIEFAAGLLMGVFWLRSTRDYSFTSPIHPMIVLSALMILFVALNFWLRVPFHRISSNIISSLICIPILLIGSHIRCPHDLLDKFANLLGNASFSIYLFHMHFISAILGIWAKIRPDTPIGLVIFVTSLASIMAGVTIYVLIEKPVLRWTRMALEPWISPGDSQPSGNRA